MENEVKIFESPEFGQVRTITKDDEVWFVGKDVADILGYSNPNDAISKHVDDEDKGVAKCDTLGGTQKMTIINESGMYSLILSSKLPSAKRFKRWITSEVIPSIRKHGAYMTENTIQKALESPDFLIELATKLKEEKEKNKALEEEAVAMSNVIEEMKPKVNYVDRILSSKETLTTTQVATDYGMSAIAFNKLLNKLRIQRKVGGQWVLYAEYLGNGFTKNDTYNVNQDDNNPFTVTKTKWTQKGRLFLYEELKKNGIHPIEDESEKLQ